MCDLVEPALKLEVKIMEKLRFSKPPIIGG
jgi:hypothetical protein